MTRLCLSAALILSIALTSACATGEAPEAVDSNRVADRAGEPTVVIQLEDESAFDRFDQVWVEVSGVEVYDVNTQWNRVDVPTQTIDIFERTNGFNTGISRDPHAKIRLTITSAFGVGDGVSEDLEIVTFTAVVTNGVAVVDVRPADYRTSSPER